MQSWELQLHVSRSNCSSAENPTKHNLQKGWKKLWCIEEDYIEENPAKMKGWKIILDEDTSLLKLNHILKTATKTMQVDWLENDKMTMYIKF